MSKLLLPFFLVLSLVTVTSVIARDYGGGDHPLVPRLAGSSIIGHESVNFGEYYLALGTVIREPFTEDTAPPVGVRSGSRYVYPQEYLKLEGTITKITYITSEEISTLEVARNYQQQLVRSGFAILYTGQDETVDHYGTWHGNFYDYLLDFDRIYSRLDYLESPMNPRYLAARLARPGGDIYVSLYAHSGHRFALDTRHRGAKIQLDIIEVSPKAGERVTIDTLGERLYSTGSVSVYGIEFAFDSAELLPESISILAEVADLLLQDPQLNLYVVGHTDDVGRLDYNLNLSERRAQSVVDYLVQQGIRRQRLTAAGVGPLSPAANNYDENLRAQNRRVELVRRLD